MSGFNKVFGYQSEVSNTPHTLTLSSKDKRAWDLAFPSTTKSYCIVQRRCSTYLSYTAALLAKDRRKSPCASEMFVPKLSKKKKLKTLRSVGLRPPSLRFTKTCLDTQYYCYLLHLCNSFSNQLKKIEPCFLLKRILDST